MAGCGCDFADDGGDEGYDDDGGHDGGAGFAFRYVVEELDHGVSGCAFEEGGGVCDGET